MNTQASLSKTVSIEELYRLYAERIRKFIRTRVENREEAENLSQDVWIKLLGTDVEISSETALSYLYKVAVNIVNDYLRKIYIRIEALEEVERLYMERTIATPAQEYAALELARFEQQRVECMPAQRRTIYRMSRFEDMAVGEIAESLSLSFRTVENHLRMGRHDVRGFMSAIA